MQRMQDIGSSDREVLEIIKREHRRTEEGVELILDIKTGKIVELNYLENC